MAETLDIGIYDNPSVLVGGQTVEPLTMLRHINRTNFPRAYPPDRGLGLFAEWLATSNGKLWVHQWNELKQLTPDEYIHLFSNFPDPLLKRSPKDATQRKVALSMSKHYKIIGTWLLWLAHSGRAKPSILEREDYAAYQLIAEWHEAKRTLCQQIIDRPEFKYAGWFDFNPSCLWFWAEVSRCKYSLICKGISKSLEPNQVCSKTQAIKNGNELLTAFSPYETESEYFEIRGFLPVLQMLSDVVTCVSCEIARKDEDFRDTYYEPYYKLWKKLNRSIDRDKSWAMAQLYQDAENIEIFEPKKGKRLPKPRTNKALMGM